MNTKKRFRNLLISGKLGDGCLVQQTPNSSAHISFVSANPDYLTFKRDIVAPIAGATKFRPKESGFKKGKFNLTFSSRVHTEIQEVRNLTILEAIAELNKESFVQLYLDDGSYHKRNHMMHIYCNSFSIEEVNALTDKIYEMYPIKRAKIYWDRKKDGRKYPYIAINKATANVIKKDVEKFLIEEEIYSMLYKVGIYDLPSETIESGIVD